VAKSATLTASGSEPAVDQTKPRIRSTTKITMMAPINPRMPIPMSYLRADR
jgi:hypothetical protein